MSEKKYIKSIFEKGFGIVSERPDKKESWFPYIDLFDSNGDFFDACNCSLKESSKLFAALLKISEGKDLEGVEFIYSEIDGRFVIRIADTLYFIPAPREYLRNNGVHEYHCKDEDIEKYLKTISTTDLLKVDHYAIIKPENARELVTQIKTLA